MVRVDVEEFAGKRQICRAPCIRQVSELPDANEAAWQDVLDKATEKLMRGEDHFALLAAMRVVLPRGIALPTEGGKEATPALSAPTQHLFFTTSSYFAK